MIREMDSCNNGVVSLNSNQTKEENWHPKEILEKNLITKVE